MSGFSGLGLSGWRGRGRSGSTDAFIQKLCSVSAGKAAALSGSCCKACPLVEESSLFLSHLRVP